MDLGRPSPENGGISEKIEKSEKKIEKFFEKKIFQKKICHFLIPGENWSEKKFFLAWILTVIFRPVLAQKNT